ncbi:hypothetical protein DH2020_045134 [Rehmannia glutinosa]|uniref:Pectinesterase n=1 Tax=Rehmannia glutinosa TaxID=99300 RepID=A0ABR0UF91_REHGL
MRRSDQEDNRVRKLRPEKKNTRQARWDVPRIGTFNALSITNREQLALADCKELLDFSVSELGWSMSEMNKIRSGFKNPNSDGNLKAWLSAALSNQDTCLEGFEGTDRRLERYVRGSLSQVTQLIGNVLTLYTQMHSLPFKPSRNNNNNNNTSKGFFPKWMTDGDKEMLVSSPNGMHVDSVVALDGSGRYRSIGQAIFEAPSYSNRRYVIYVKKGVYKENIDMKKKKTNIMLVGDGIGKTVITGNRNFMQGWTTFRTATVAVSGKGFIARDITFATRPAGEPPGRGPPRRLRPIGLLPMQHGRVPGHTLRPLPPPILPRVRHLRHHRLHLRQRRRRPPELQDLHAAATAPPEGHHHGPGPKGPHQSTGFSIQDSYVYATRPTYLGRPWKLYSRTVFINTYMSSMVQPRGWLEWYGDFGLGTLWYGEYRNYGPGAKTSGRVKWPGYHIIRDASTAGFFSVGRFLNGMSWLPATGVKFTAGLTN